LQLKTSLQIILKGRMRRYARYHPTYPKGSLNLG